MSKRVMPVKIRDDSDSRLFHQIDAKATVSWLFLAVNQNAHTMLGETYTLYDNFGESLKFSFYSEGPQGIIHKGIEFTRIYGKLYNLGFGDILDGKIDDSVVSNNSDIVKVMNTIAKAVYLFSGKFPGSEVYIQPLDRRRSLLYHRIFKNYLEEIEVNFEIWGFVPPNWEKYIPEKQYFAFKLKLIP